MKLTLFPLLLALLLGACGEESPRHEVPTDVAVCVERLRELYTALRTHEAAHGSAPAVSGDGFLVELFRAGTLADTPENRALLACPGPGARAVRPDLDLTRLPAPGTFASSYAARDQEAHPLTFPAGGRIPVLACDGGAGPNHARVTNVLYADGTVRTFRLQDLLAREAVPAGTQELVVGPTSALSDLRVLIVD